MKFTKVKFTYRFIILVISFFFVFLVPQKIELIPNVLFQLVWLYLMCEQIVVLFPKTSHKTPFGKHFSKHYKQVKSFDKEKLKALAKTFNKRSILTFVLWWLMIYLISLIKTYGYINDLHVYFVAVLFYFFDHFCINIWCPFHKFLIRNKCCNTCRIFNWGHFMIYSPLVMVPNFYTLTLFVTSMIILLQWEVNHYLYPERFYEISNENLKCNSCNIDCRFKRK